MRVDFTTRRRAHRVRGVSRCRTLILIILLGLVPGMSGMASAQAHGPEQPAAAQPQAQDPHASPTAAGAQAQAHTTEGAGEEHHEEGILPTVAKLFNFAILVGTLVYFLKSPIAAYLQSRSTEIRQDLVTAAEMRAAATAQLAEIDRKLQTLPAELEALRARGAEDVRSEQMRMAEAATTERERLLEQTRREISMRLRIARRDLVEHAAELAVRVARERISRSITSDDQLRMLDRYASQLQQEAR